MKEDRQPCLSGPRKCGPNGMRRWCRQSPQTRGQLSKCPCHSVPECHSPVMLITPKCVILASCLSFRLPSNSPLDIYPPGCDPEVAQTLSKTEHTFLPRLALPPVFSQLPAPPNWKPGSHHPIYSVNH